MVTNLSVMKSKQELRREIWRRLEREKAARFPGAEGRIPNFVGAEKAARRAAELPIWKQARVLKCNPDAPQLPVRKLALEEGKKIYMAVPRLRESRCFVELDPGWLKALPREAASIRGAFRFGRQVTLEEMQPIDLVVAGSVAVNRLGARIGKGGGYSDLEFGLARQRKLLTEKTPVLTTVHPLQLVEEEIPVLPHDIPVDYIILPEEIIETNTRLPKPQGIYWEFLDEEKIQAIPVLVELRGR
ncbi:MAG: 5-formyltetrahydrofolate cyclo-ligase [Acidobacteria bacterium]|nr:5-formyltetrahydrofolate cyclo-ligase [Acidobacteriota bacterium]